VGTKADLFDRKLRINSSIYYYNYTNKQVFAFGGTGDVPVSILENANSHIYGGEAEVTALPVRNLKLHGGIAYTHARYTEIHDARGDFVGNTNEKTPTVQITADASYGWDFTDQLRGSIGVDGSYQTKTFLDPSNEADLVSPAHGLVNAHLEIAGASDRITTTVWVKNLADRRYIQDGFDFSALSGVDYIYNMPRTFGITIAFKM
jgi:iron complex outermembrane receptor protein